MQKSHANKTIYVRAMRKFLYTHKIQGCLKAYTFFLIRRKVIFIMNGELVVCGAVFSEQSTVMAKTDSYL